VLDLISKTGILIIVRGMVPLFMKGSILWLTKLRLLTASPVMHT
jgi:hypothetical protein